MDNCTCKNCQAPIKETKDFGTNNDSTKNSEYCSDCYNDGELNDSDINLDEIDTFCQSCAMPMASAEDYGTTINGLQNTDYCCYCYQNGEFTQPNLTKEEMIEKVSEILTQMQIPQDQVDQVKSFIPMLKRWINN